MYGLVNRGIEAFAMAQGGEPLWEQILAEAGIEEEEYGFISIETYPDELTYRLVEAAATVLSIPDNQILQLFGEYWIRYTEETGYGSLMSICGNNFKEFLDNLDSMHARVKVSLDHLEPPRFECDMLDNGVELRYFSQRTGLEPMVTGILYGLSKKFNQPIDVSLISSKDNRTPYSLFFIQYL